MYTSLSTLTVPASLAVRVVDQMLVGVGHASHDGFVRRLPVSRDTRVHEEWLLPVDWAIRGT